MGKVFWVNLFFPSKFRMDVTNYFSSGEPTDYSDFPNAGPGSTNLNSDLDLTYYSSKDFNKDFKTFKLVSKALGVKSIKKLEGSDGEGDNVIEVTIK